MRRDRHRHLHWRRLRIPAALAFVLLGVVLGLHAAGLIYNSTPSEPTGFYWLSAIPAAGVKAGDRVSFCPPLRQTDYPFLEHGSCPGGTAPFFKTVAGVPGDEVMVTPARVTINGRVLPGSTSLLHSRAYPALKMAHAYGVWRLGVGQYWLYGAGLPQYSFDSRYWGVVRGNAMLGVAGRL
jgi:conjugative transfer signal peptidase TraF